MHHKARTAGGSDGKPTEGQFLITVKEGSLRRWHLHWDLNITKEFSHKKPGDENARQMEKNRSHQVFIGIMSVTDADQRSGQQWVSVNKGLLGCRHTRVFMCHLGCVQALTAWLSHCDKKHMAHQSKALSSQGDCPRIEITRPLRVRPLRVGSPFCLHHHFLRPSLCLTSRSQETAGGEINTGHSVSEWFFFFLRTPFQTKSLEIIASENIVFLPNLTDSHMSRGTATRTGDPDNSCSFHLPLRISCKGLRPRLVPGWNGAALLQEAGWSGEEGSAWGITLFASFAGNPPHAWC